jgi:hypothetical protein
MMSFRKIFRKNKLRKRRFLRFMAVFTAFTMLFEGVFPLRVFALTGGPSQPEVQSFEPVGTSDMVDPFTGDFTYNIPLMDVDGYPINISYHSGITMDQEASWVGLGWNISPGVINRGMRGIPDDFKGDEIVKEMSMKPNKTYGLSTGAGLEFAGTEESPQLINASIGYSIGVRYNNYTGLAIEQSLNTGIQTGNAVKGPLSGGLGLNIASSSDNGLSISPSVSFGLKVAKTDKMSTSLGLHIGSSFNSRAGLQNLTYGLNATYSYNYSANVFGKTKKVDNSLSKGIGSCFNFGMPTYTPQVSMPMRNSSGTGSFKLGFENLALHPNFTISGYYSEQRLATDTITNKAYGYLNSDEGEKYDNAILDFNREKDGSFTPNTVAMPLTNFTYDIYSVSGQGVGGSYRPYRGDIGHVFDAAASTTSDSWSAGGELGIGNVFHAGIDVNTTDVYSHSGRWRDGNEAAAALKFKSTTDDPLYEKYYFKEANEKSVDADPSFLAKVGGYDAVRINLDDSAGKFNIKADDKFSNGTAITTSNYRQKREKRNQAITVITRKELNDGFGIQYPDENLLITATTGDLNYNSEAKKHHIAEITALNTSGARYVYGIAAYNTKQEETTFAVAQNGREVSTGLVKYDVGYDNNLTNNNKGLDNYFSNTITPAYAHSYLLTAVLSPDYVDADDVKGPSDGDLGSYTKLSYYKVLSPYKWRVPVEEGKATYNEGLKSVDYDDKANYIYGEKELWYMETIQTKNYIAIFTLEDRKDGCGVNSKDGGVSTVAPMKLLRKISLYSKKDYYEDKSNAIPIKEVHFEYDYSLCPNVTNNSGIVENDANNNNINASKGKLTLKKIYFTYGNSNKARLSPYVFTYSDDDENPNYNLKNYDRWGNYKEQDSLASFEAEGHPAPNAEFPYVEQDLSKANESARAWALTNIGLPSGGQINVNYEADDYAYVQNKQAMQMFKIFNIGESPDNYDLISKEFYKDTEEHKNRLWFKLSKDKNGSPITNMDYYFKGIDKLYFRFLMQINPIHTLLSPPRGYEYVSGYADMANAEKGTSGDYGYIKLATVKLNDNGNDTVCPIIKSAIQFGRLNLSKEVWGDETIAGDGLSLKDILTKIVNSGFVHNISQAIQGPNKALYNNGVGTEAVMNKCWIRLNNVTGHKYGGGSRVKKITISDEWGEMTNKDESTYSYGQEYTYTNDDGSSSGVASYEPQIGGDENPWKTPVFFKEENLLAPDDEHYMETPFGESFFPSPSVGYSKVTVKNLQRSGVTRNATGSVVHEFYTAKDFPTITERTDIDARREKSKPLGLSSLLHIDVKDYMTASQGYVIELNDMHGKPKSQKVYQEGQTTPISSVEYKYKSTPYLKDSYRLDNKATVVNRYGDIDTTATIGVFFDVVSDMREESTTTLSTGANGNLDFFVIPFVPPLPITLPVVLPSFSSEKTQFRSAVVTKVVQRFGILEETIAKDLGSEVSTKNLAYDAETGDVLLTQTTTDFNDAIYSFTYPAHWYYDGMGAAYKNIGFTKDGVSFNTQGIAGILNADKYFAEGDELEMTCKYSNNEYNINGWVTEVLTNGIRIVDKQGNDLSEILPGQVLPNHFASIPFSIKVLRSGRRNQQSTPMASITTLVNPLSGVKTNLYDKVLQAGASEFTNNWKTFCDCFVTNPRGKDGTVSLQPIYTTNPFILGTKGMWKLKRSYLYLSERTQSNYNNNTNIRTDGMFTSYSPYYKLNAGKWAVDGRNWTYTSEVTEFSPFGVELENKDALGRYSAAQYGYNQSLATGVAANTRYRNLGIDNFEDYGFSDCADNHFKFNKDQQVVIDGTQSHTGSKSIKVNNQSPVTMKKQLAVCDSSLCSVYITLLNRQPSDQDTIYVMRGTAPYLFDWDIVGDEVDITLSNDGLYVIFTKPINPATIEISVVDKNGCGVIRHIVCNAQGCSIQQ